MEVTINGRREEVPDSTSVEMLLESKGLVGKACAVEINKGIIPKARHQEHVLEDGDSVEIVTLVGGG